MKTTLLQIFFILTLFTIAIKAQQFKMISADDAQMVPEIKGVILFEQGKVVVGPIPPADQRDGDYKSLDLKSGDEIQFVNGKRIKSIEDFKDNYSKVKSGEEIKFGVKRGSDRFIVSFKRSDEKVGEGNIMRINSDGKGAKGKVKIENGKLIMNGKKLDLDSLKKAGGKIQIKKEKE